MLLHGQLVLLATHGVSSNPLGNGSFGGPNWWSAGAILVVALFVALGVLAAIRE